MDNIHLNLNRLKRDDYGMGKKEGAYFKVIYRHSSKRSRESQEIKRMLGAKGRNIEN